MRFRYEPIDVDTVRVTTREFFTHYNHMFLMEYYRSTEGIEVFKQAVAWCEERWGKGVVISAYGEDNFVDIPLDRWIYQIMDGIILISDPNRAFEFRMRWC